MMDKEPTPEKQPEFESIMPPPSLIDHMGHYLHLIQYPDPDLTIDDGYLVAGEYFNDNIKGKYSDHQLSMAFWMYGL